jgi:mono/diheme cytochrome c family protein
MEIEWAQPTTAQRKEFPVKNFFFGVLTMLALIVIGGLIYLKLGFAEVRGDLPPSNLESALMYSAVHASVRRSAPEIPNPVTPTDEHLIAGGKIYLNECSGCHGAPGKPDESSTTLFPPIPQLPAAGTEYTEAQIFWIAKHGIRRTGMFANGKWDSDEKLWTVAAFIKRIRSLPPQVQEALKPKPSSGT